MRPARADDAAALCDVHARAIRALPGPRPTAAQREAWMGRMRPESYLEPMPSRVRIVAELGPPESTRIIGYAQLHVAEGTVEAVYVDPDFARRGVGRALALALEREARARGLPGLVVEATENSVPFYGALGFLAKAVDRHRLAPGVNLECAVMEKRLGPGPGPCTRPVAR
jgi:GNAT superfamily N-acetyltransferase